MANLTNRILILGANGQVGRELTRTCTSLGEIVALDRSQADLANVKALRETIRRIKPQVILNAAAYTAVDKAESEPELAHRVNAVAPAGLAEYAAESGALLVHYSTDYVYDGTGDAPRDETAPTAPLSVYGATKLDGEQRIAATGCTHLILRTSWVYAARGQNFLHTMLRLACEREFLSVVDDQVGVPTHAGWLAAMTAEIVPAVLKNSALSGLYHLVPAGETTWYRYAQYAIETARQRGMTLQLPREGLRAITTADYPAAARRPLNSRLSTAKWQRVFGITPPDWTAAVQSTVLEIISESVIESQT